MEFSSLRLVFLLESITMETASQTVSVINFITYVYIYAIYLYTYTSKL